MSVLYMAYTSNSNNETKFGVLSKENNKMSKCLGTNIILNHSTFFTVLFLNIPT